MTIELPDLPYPHDALQPHISAQTLEFHHGKHHRGYVSKLNAEISDTPWAEQPLEQIVRESHEQNNSSVFNNAAQAWNHAFLWRSMRPGGGGEPGGEIGRLIEQSFGGYDRFCTEFAAAAKGQFGSGWAWLVRDGDKLKIIATANADTPLVQGLQPLLTLDVWEHAYYLDYQNDRAGYIDGFLRHLANWRFAETNLERRQAAA